MKPSPIQAKHIGFYSVEVTPRKLEDDENSGSSFDWNGVVIGSPVKHFSVGEDPYSKIVTLDIIVKNQEGKRKAPYNIEISSWGVFDCLNQSTPENDALDLIVVNGASMLYGAIRELLYSLTLRMTNSELLLPTGNFLDSKPSLKEHNQSSTTKTNLETQEPSQSNKKKSTTSRTKNKS